MIAARNATLAVFAMNGTNFASWASRIPEIKEVLGLTPGALGLVLLAVSAGSLLGLPVSGRVTHRFGAARTVAMGAVLVVIGQFIALAGVETFTSREVVMVGLFLTGLGMGTWDVAMNLEGSVVEHRLRRAIMPWFHAAFSGGTVVAALVGAALSAAHTSLWLHIGAAQLICLAVIGWQVTKFLPADHDPAQDEATTAPVGPQRSAWTELRTLLVGVVTLAAAFTEGTANDWMAVAFVDGHHTQHWVGVLGLAVFLAFMTAGRVFGTHLLDTHGRVVVLRVLLGLAAVGCALVVFGGIVGAFVGAALWGLGASLGFPVGMSAAADDPRRAPARISVVSTIGYLAFLGGPPVLGWLGDHVGVLHSLLAVGLLLVLAFFLSPVTAPEQAAPRQTRGA